MNLGFHQVRSGFGELEPHLIVRGQGLLSVTLKDLSKATRTPAIGRRTHVLLVQDSPDGFVLAALVPSTEIAVIWLRQRDVSDDLLARGLAGRTTKNHAANGNSPTLWLQDDRHAATPAVARVLWEWPGVVNVMALPVTEAEIDTDTMDDLPVSDIGRDGAERERTVRSGYWRC